jgi:hypothetical protein
MNGWRHYWQTLSRQPASPQANDEGFSSTVALHPAE